MSEDFFYVFWNTSLNQIHLKQDAGQDKRSGRFNGKVILNCLGYMGLRYFSTLYVSK